MGILCIKHFKVCGTNYWVHLFGGGAANNHKYDPLANSYWPRSLAKGFYELLVQIFPLYR